MLHLVSAPTRWRPQSLWKRTWKACARVVPSRDCSRVVPSRLPSKHYLQDVRL